MINHDYINEVQTVAQLFFPNSRFAFSNNIEDVNSQTGYSAVSRLTVRYESEIYFNGNQIAKHSADKNVRDSTLAKKYLNDKKMIMLSLFSALNSVLKTNPPWGALTGVRPSKLVRQWLEECYDENEIIRFLTDEIHCRNEKALLAIESAKSETVVAGKIISIAESLNKNPVCLYVGIPFCPSRCLYCSFNAGHMTAEGEGKHGEYVSALVRELREKSRLLEKINGVVTSVYVGGGTPVHLSERHLELLFESINKHFTFIPNFEFTVEAGRPDSLTPVKLKIMKNLGVNRIAVNPQTLNDKTLASIGREHTAGDFFNAFEAARRAGFNNINTDVIAGLPGETVSDVKKTLGGVLALKPENVTVHTLAVKRASKMNENLLEYKFPSASETDAMVETALSACREAGMAPYYLYRQKNSVGSFENTGYCLPGRECAYNVGMMSETQTVLGAGAGAVSKFLCGSRIERKYNIKNIDLYIQKYSAGEK